MRNVRERAIFGMAKCGAGKFWYQFVNAATNIDTNPPIVAQEQAWTGPVVACCHLLEASGWLLGWLPLFPGGCRAQWKCAWEEIPKRHLEMRLRTFKCRGIIWHTFVVPTFVLSNSPCS